jgi:diadenylate cyclase
MLNDFISTFRWLHLIDILILSFILHRIFLLLRGRNAFQMMLGIISILLLQAAARAFGLVLTSWFLAGLGAIALVAVVILFRWEIRELLMQINPVHLLGGMRSSLQTGHQLDALVTAVFELAQSGTGALIVVQNHDLLSEHLHNGYELNGKLIPEIIRSIFAKESPVHDGAIVIKGNRIEWVGTFLPLTTSEMLPSQFGTRHRAAVGLTENTDAIVIVVSEERGEVVLVEKGSLKIIRDHEELRHHLSKVSEDQPVQEGYGARARAGLIKASGFALIFLTVSSLWGIYFGRQSLIEVNKPIDFRNISKNLILKRSSAEAVDIQISGNRLMVNDLEAGDVRVFVDMTELRGGVHTIVLENKNVELPAGLRVTQILPHQIRVDLDRLIEKKLAIKPNLVGRAPEGYRISHIQVEPDTIVVNGPSSELLFDIIYTAPINLEEIESSKEGVAMNVSLQFPHSAIEPVDQNFSVEVRIGLVSSSE